MPPPRIGLTGNRPTARLLTNDNACTLIGKPGARDAWRPARVRDRPHPTPMKRSALTLSRLAALLPWIALAPLGAQVAPPAAPPVAAAPAVQLSAFEVSVDPNDTYQALNTTSLTGTNRSLERVPITAEIFNSTMMQDLGTSDVVELLTNRMTGIGAGENSGGSSAANGALAGEDRKSVV